jgi:hypothetical protein
MIPHAFTRNEATLTVLSTLERLQSRITDGVCRRRRGYGSGYDSRESKSERITAAHGTKFSSASRETAIAYRRKRTGGGQQSGDDRKAHHGHVDNKYEE